MGDVYELVAHTTGLGQRMVNVFHFEEIAPPTAAGASASDLALDFKANALTPFMDAKSALVVCDRITVRCVRPNNALFHEEIVSPTVPGTRDAGLNLMPLSCAVVISWRTPQAGGSHRGRTYMSGYTETDHAQGLWVGASLAGCIDFAEAMQDRYDNTGASSFRHSVWSRPYAAHTTYHRTTGVATALAAYAGQVTHITGFLVREIVHIQRRRTIGQGV